MWLKTVKVNSVSLISTSGQRVAFSARSKGALSLADHAGLLLVKFGMRRRKFREEMNGEVEAGQIVIVGWFEQNGES